MGAEWITTIIDGLRQRRTIFHSEADFQQELAWQIRLQHPGASLRLEVRPDATVREALDLLAVVGDRRIAIELKHFTAKTTAVVDGEPFSLSERGARDVDRYSFIKDIVRLERFCGVGGTSRFADKGYAIALCNDPGFWEPSKRSTPDDAFKLDDGRVLQGTLDWSGDVTGWRAKHPPLHLANTYELHWSDFSTVPSSPQTTFKLLVVPVSIGIA